MHGQSSTVSSAMVQTWRCIISTIVQYANLCHVLVTAGFFILCCES